jgi:hypothetical protein
MVCYWLNDGYYILIINYLKILFMVKLLQTPCLDIEVKEYKNQVEFTILLKFILYFIVEIFFTIKFAIEPNKLIDNGKYG